MSNMKEHLAEFEALKAENARLRAENSDLKLRLANGLECIREARRLMDRKRKL